MKRRIGLALRSLRARLVYRLDSWLGRSPFVQLAALSAGTALLVVVFAAARGGDDPASAIWWVATHFMDGGTMASDATGRPLAVFVTVAGTLTVSLLTAALASKMGERIGDLRSGANPVVERGHVLVLGYDANVPLLAREIARSGQRCTLVVLAADDKDKIEAALRPASRVVGSRMRAMVRTGDPRSELALMRVSAHRARAVLVMPPPALEDDESLRWALATVLAMRRIAREGFRGQLIVEARRCEARELLELAGEPGVAGPRELPIEVVASDEVLACVLAQSTRDDAVYFVLRHLLAFDGCEPYAEAVPARLVGATLDEAHSRVDGAIVIGVRRRGAPALLCPSDAAELVLTADDELLVLARAHGALGLGPALPPVAPLAATDGELVVDAPPPERVAIIGVTHTLPHLLRELDEILPAESVVTVVTDGHANGAAVVLAASAAARRIVIDAEHGRAAPLCRDAVPPVCGADAIVILGHEHESDENGDASALATLLRLRHGMRATGRHKGRVVTELRDPRSAAHIVPRQGDCIVSSDLVAMLLAQAALDRKISPIYRELLHSGGASVAVRPAASYGGAGATFAEVMARARARGEIAIGLYPDPRRRGREEEIARDQLEDGGPSSEVDAWLSPPRETRLPAEPEVRVIVLGRAQSR
jgi:hypothetical protein